MSNVAAAKGTANPVHRTILFPIRLFLPIAGQALLGTPF
jgi:hypothetical protein